MNGASEDERGQVFFPKVTNLSRGRSRIGSHTVSDYKSCLNRSSNGHKRTDCMPGVVGGWQISELALHTPASPEEHLGRRKAGLRFTPMPLHRGLPLLLSISGIGKTVFGWTSYISSQETEGAFVWLPVFWVEQSKWQKMSWTSLGIYVCIYIFAFFGL